MFWKSRSFLKAKGAGLSCSGDAWHSCRSRALDARQLGLGPWRGT